VTIAASTNAIRAWRTLERLPNSLWVDWATERMDAGDDTPSLRILAGLTGSFDQIDVTRLLDACLSELGVEPLDRETAVKVYASELLKNLLGNTQPVRDVLRELGDLCIQTEYDRELYPFYLLHFALWDLEDGEVQWYWDGADRSNIDGIVRKQASEWLVRHAPGA